MIGLRCMTSSEIPLPSPPLYSLSGWGPAAIGHTAGPSHPRRARLWLLAGSCVNRLWESYCEDVTRRMCPIRTRLKTLISRGVWLGRHACYRTTQAS